MDKSTRQPDASSIGEEQSTSPYVLPSTFSPWRSDTFVPDGDVESIRSDTQVSPTPPERSVSPSITNSNATRPPSPRPSTFTPAAAATSDQTVSELVLTPADHGMYPKTEVVISAGNANAAPRQKQSGLRRTRFKEMLGRSISSTRLFDNNRSSSPHNTSYDPVGESRAAQTHSGTEDYPMCSVPYRSRTRAETYSSQGEDGNGDDMDELAARYARPPLDCHSRRDVYIKRRSWTYIVLMALSIYSTVLSALWFVVSIYQPRYGRGISSSEGWKMAPSTATLLCTLFAKTIELSFVTVFVALLGQVLTRRAFVRKSKGVTLAEMTMRNWVIQPGSLLTYWEGIPNAAPTLLGLLTLIATICSMFYTTASDAMVSPKLKFGDWESREIAGLVKASYANPYYVQKACSTPIDQNLDMVNAAPSCLDVQYSGQSYHNLLTFMYVTPPNSAEQANVQADTRIRGEWHSIHENGTSTIDYLSGRPTGKHNLFDNTTIVSSWIETEFGNPRANFAAYGRTVNNVTLAIPHPGVFEAAMDPRNDILQPDDLAGVGEYSIRASVVSPVINVMCVNMARDELAPLVYTRWPDARTELTDIPGQRTGVDDWFNDVPPPTNDEWLNRTVVDDIFRWGPKYRRRPPVFQLFPIDYNMLTNTSVAGSDSIYLLAKSGVVADFTLCELRSWVTPKCSTEFDVSGISGGHMRAHCEDPDDANSYLRGSGSEDARDPPYVSGDWRNMADQWRLSMDLNGGVQNNNASNARIITNFILREPALDPLLPSMAEALAVLASSTLVAGSLSSTYRARWDYSAMELDPGAYEAFHVSIRTQQYASSHVQPWQAVFYTILGLVFAINVACFLYLTLFRRGLVADYTEPQNLFAVAINSPPSRALAGSCGHGPDSAEMVVGWRVGYSFVANHYFFQEAEEPGTGGDGGRTKERYARPNSTCQSVASGSDLLSVHGRYRNNYERLSTGRTWL
ncbi:hypothetical protein AAE478_006769 [Parahypoxylon ruwenzoriense]